MPPSEVKQSPGRVILKKQKTKRHFKKRKRHINTTYKVYIIKKVCVFGGASAKPNRGGIIVAPTSTVTDWLERSVTVTVDIASDISAKASLTFHW